MGKIAIICFGVGLTLFSGLGVWNNQRDIEELVALGDKNTIGKIVRLGKVASADGEFQYLVKYGFRTPDKKAFYGKLGVRLDEIKKLKKGDKVTVFYEEDAPESSTAFTLANTPDVNFDARRNQKICFGIGAFGVLVAVLGFFCTDENLTEPKLIQAQQKFSDNPQAALRRWRSEWEIGPSPV